MAKRGATLEDKYIGKEPLFTGEEEFTPSEYQKATNWYNYFYKNKDYLPNIYRFAEDVMGYDKKKVSVLKKVKDWKFLSAQKIVQLYYRGWKFDEAGLQRAKDTITLAYKEGLQIKAEVAEKKKNVVVISPAERTRRKVVDTIYHDWDSEIVEAWFDGDYVKKFSCYNRFKMHGLKSNAINIFKSMIDDEYQNIKDAYEKNCEQCVEAYSHIGKADKRKMMKQFETVFEDLEKLRLSFKATRTPRMRKPKSSDQQVSRLQYSQEDLDSKLVSINPVLIPGSNKLYVYNTKQRKLTEYTTNSTKGFEVSGTTIKNFDDSSRTATLRKPEDVLPLILSKTEKQIEKIWDGITTKINKPTGRINADCILMRVF
tara:strand:- start:1647 stop:2756 length:1110 start_codon:yes stop_codon:yes gene_type:complete